MARFGCGLDLVTVFLYVRNILIVLFQMRVIVALLVKVYKDQLCIIKNIFQIEYVTSPMIY